uniref:Heterokaryon incompatibility domain-containing protein n=1 Tax=Bionectria ochroleuca TaxID=29856 RepID=A0A0B7JYH3_BIOOC
MLQLNESQSVYHYQALPRSRVIRVLILFPGAGDDLIRVSLQVASLDDEPEFEAISYVWGDPTSRKTIYCDGVCISVTANLYAALHNFRLEDKPRRLWADALCINQEDLDEKSFHVQMMQTVYQSCIRCLVWLGAPDAHSDTALALVQAITLLYTRHLGIAVDQADRHLDQHGRNPMLAQKIGFEGLPPKDSEQWSSLFQFLCRPWFSRVWVIQEAYFSGDVLFFYGNGTTTYAPLYFAADWVLVNGTKVGYNKTYDPADYSSSMCFNIMKMRPDNWTRENQSLDSLLDGCKRFGATNLRDKVYALMHLPAFKREYPDIKPNYRVSVEEAYVDVTMVSIRRNKDFVILTRVDRELGDQTPVLQLPSWVPRWNRGDETSSASTTWYKFYAAGKGKSSAESSSAPFSAELLSGHRLQVAGFEFDKVEDVAELTFIRGYNATPPAKPHFSSLRPWKRYDPNSETGPYATAPAIIDAYAMTMTAMCREFEGFYALHCAPENEDHHRSDFVAWLQWLRRPDTEEYLREGDSHYPPGLYSDEKPFLNDTTDEELEVFYSRYNRMVRMYNLGRRLIRTRNDYLGTGSHEPQMGDLICIFFGSAVPFILRPREGGNGFILVGDAYIHGIMNGEALETLDNGKFTKRNFVIH